MFVYRFEWLQTGVCLLCADVFIRLFPFHCWGLYRLNYLLLRHHLGHVHQTQACSLQRIGRKGMHQSVSHRKCIALRVAQERNAQLAHCLCTRTQTHNTHRHAHTDTDTQCFSCPAKPIKPDVRFLSQHRSKPQDCRPMMWRGPRPWNEFQCLRDSLNGQLSGWPKCWWNGWLRCQQHIGSVKIGNQWCRHAGSVCLLTQQMIHRWRRSRLRGWLSGRLNSSLSNLLNDGLKSRSNQKRYSRARNLMCSFRT